MVNLGTSASSKITRAAIRLWNNLYPNFELCASDDKKIVVIKRIA